MKTTCQIQQNVDKNAEPTCIFSDLQQIADFSKCRSSKKSIQIPLIEVTRSGGHGQTIAEFGKTS